MNDDIKWYLRRVGAFQHVRTILHLNCDVVTINRSDNATHTFQSRVISRRHATLTNVNGRWILRDEGGLNGTFLNTDKLDPSIEYPLVENDIIGFGMPLSQQDEECSVVYRLCKEAVNRPSTSGGTTNDTELVVPNDQDNQDETIVQPTSATHQSAHSAIKIEMTPADVEVINLEDSDDEAPPPVVSTKQATGAKPKEATTAVDHEASMKGNFINVWDEENDTHGCDDKKTLRANDTTKPCGNQQHIKPCKTNGNLLTKPTDQQGETKSNGDGRKKLVSVVMKTTNAVSPDLFPEDAISTSKNESFKISAPEQTDEDSAPMTKSTTGDWLVVSDEIAQSPREQSSDSEHEELCDDIGYSQDDEVIIISDDESYVTHKNIMANSQLGVVVKEEAMEENGDPCNLEENDDWDKMFHERLMEDISNDCASELPKSTVRAQQEAKSYCIPENIHQKLPLTKSSRVSIEDNNYEALAVPGTSGINTTGRAEMAEDLMDTNDFFPELSQNFYEGDNSSDDEENDSHSHHSSDDENDSEPENEALMNVKMQITGTFYGSGSKGNYDRLKNKPGQMPSHGVQLTKALPNVRGRRTTLLNSAPLPRSPSRTAAQKRLVPPRRVTGPSKMKQELKKKFINGRIPIPGGGTDNITGRRSPTKKKPSFHVTVKPGNDMRNKHPNNNSVKSSSSGLHKHLKQDVNGNKEASSNNASKEKDASNVVPQEVPRERRAPTVRSRIQMSRNEHLAADLMESTSIPPKRKGSPSRIAKPPPPKKLQVETPANGSEKEKDKRSLIPPKKAIFLADPAPISTKHQPPVNRIGHKPPVNHVRQQPPVNHVGHQPLNASGTSNLCELDIRNRQSNRRVTFSENPPEIHYLQPDAVEDHIQLQDENAFGAAPLPAEVTSAVQRMLASVLSWKPAWLNEQEMVKHPPPVVNSRDIKNIAATYSSHAEYVKIYEPLLLLETWESISQDWRNRRNSSPLIQLVFSRIRHDTGESKSLSTYFECHAVIDDGEERRGYLPQEGWLAILDVPIDRENPEARVDGAGRSYVRTFALVESCHKSSVNYLQKDGPISPLLKQMISKHEDKKVTLKLVLQTKSLGLPVSEDRPLNLQLIAYLKPQLRVFQALHYLPFTLLGPRILKPNTELCSFSNARSSRSLQNVGKINYNETQRNVILKTTETVSSQSASPKMFLVQGPPGTGKSSLIIGLVSQLIFDTPVSSKVKPHILLCAPSNAAVDELLYRLLELRKTLPNNRKLRTIRLGLPDSIHPRVKAYSLDSIVQNNVRCEKKIVEVELNHLTTTLNCQKQKFDTLKLRNGKPSEVNKVKTDINNIESRLALVRKKLDEINRRTPEESHRVYYTWREDCLRNADVIATTLGSCTQYGMEMFLRNNNHPFICIIDEATQCIEPEMLLPLQFGVSKLVLIGDPKQLPATVLSLKANEKRLCQSLFERCYNYFENSPSNPIVMLDVQYRMHPEMCYYPSKAFYRSKLRTDSEVIRKVSVPLEPYLFFDIRDSQEESTGVGDIRNPREAVFIVALCEALLLKLTEASSLNIGVITFYQRQRHLIKEKLAASSTLQNLNKVEAIEVNTVDSFQGREKDLIIVSTVRANSSNGSIGFISKQQRLNVAITRAKSSLYICGHRDSLKTSPIWKNLIEDANYRRKLDKVASRTPVNALQDLLTKSSR